MRRAALRAVCVLGLLAAGCATRVPATPGETPAGRRGGAAAPGAVAPPAEGAAAVQALRADLVAATALPGVRHGAWGVVVESLDRRERLFELNPRTLLIPASTAKLVSVASAAEAVGWDYTFLTELHATGPIEDGVLKGDLVVVGHGDPTWSGPAGADVSALAQVLAGKVTRIEGLIVADDDQVEEPRPQLAWTWDDLGYPTGAVFGALNADQNVTGLRVLAGAAEGQPTTMVPDPNAAGRALVNRTATGAPGSRAFIWPEQRPGETPLTVAGSVPAGGPAARLAVAVGNPTLWFAQRLRGALVAAGVQVPGGAFDVDDIRPRPVLTAETLIAGHMSSPLSAIVRPLLKDSINLYAEAVMRLNAVPADVPTNDAALGGLRARLTAWNVPPDGVQLVDGSGLSRRSVIAPEALLAVLARMHDPTGRSPFVAALPVAGVDGSLARRMKGTAAEGRVLAKTGTMSNIRTLAGYATTAEGEHLAFVILLNNFEGTGTEATDAVDRMAVRIASFRRVGP